jgi:hypothetical protein
VVCLTFFGRRRLLDKSEVRRSAVHQTQTKQQQQQNNNTNKNDSSSPSQAIPKKEHSNHQP